MYIERERDMCDNPLPLRRALGGGSLKTGLTARVQYVYIYIYIYILFTTCTC